MLGIPPAFCRQSIERGRERLDGKCIQRNAKTRRTEADDAKLTCTVTEFPNFFYSKKPWNTIWQLFKALLATYTCLLLFAKEHRKLGKSHTVISFLSLLRPLDSSFSSSFILFFSVSDTREGRSRHTSNHSWLGRKESMEREREREPHNISGNITEYSRAGCPYIKQHPLFME